METIPRWNAPKINYLDTDPDTLKNNFLARLESKLGRTLEEGDPLRLVALVVINEIINARSAINLSAQLNNLAYAQGSYLDAIGTMYNCQRLSAAPAVCDLTFTLSTAQESVYTIPAGTQVSSGSNAIFATDADLIFDIGDTVGTISASSINPGSQDNGLAVGDLHIMVNPLPYVQIVTNTTKTQGGSSVETDAHYAERLHDFPSSLSTAGPESAYRYHVMSVSPAIADVKIHTPTNGRVDVYLVLDDGEIPTQTILDKVEAHLRDDEIRPFGDLVRVLAPQVVSYQVLGRYYINRSLQAAGLAIQDAVNAAVSDYITWQESKIGRDINKDELIKRMITAGAKRVELESPNYSVLAKYQIAKNSEVSMIFAGYEEG